MNQEHQTKDQEQLDPLKYIQFMSQNGTQIHEHLEKKDKQTKQC